MADDDRKEANADSSGLTEEQMKELFEATSACEVREAFRSDAQDIDEIEPSDIESVRHCLLQQSIIDLMNRNS